MYNLVHSCGYLVKLTVGKYFLTLDMVHVNVNKKLMTQAFVTAW